MIYNCYADATDYGDTMGGRGGALYNKSGDVTNVVAFNNTSFDGGGVYLAGGRLINCTAQYNMLRAASDTANVGFASEALKTAVYNTIGNGDADAANFAMVPTFKGFSTDAEKSAALTASAGKYFNRASGSSYIDAGQAVEGFEMPATDAAGQARVQGQSVDVGAYEYTQAEQVSVITINFADSLLNKDVRLGIYTTGDFQIQWGDGEKQTGSKTNYYSGTLTKPYVHIYGDNVYRLLGNNCGITAIDVTKAPAVKLLQLDGNNIETIDLRNNPLCTGIYIEGSGVKNLYLDGAKAMKVVSAADNHITTPLALTGMSVDVTKLFSQNVLICGGIYTLVAILSKLLGCGLPSLGLGFNLKGAFRIGAGMIPRGEVALIIAGIGLTAHDAMGAPIVNQDLFGVVILMTLVTTLVAPPILNISLSIKGRGIKKEIANEESQIFEWDFNNQELTHLVMDILHRDLRAEGFYVQMMNITDGICTARRSDTAISLREEGTKLIIETDEKDMGFIKGELYEIMIRLDKSMRSLSALKNTESLQYGFACPENRVTNSLTRFLKTNCISCDLKGNTKDEILEEMLTLLSQSGHVENRSMVMNALKEREKSMSTAIGKGIAIPHTKTNGVTETIVAIGIKKNGIDFGSLDGQPSKIFVMLVSPVDGANPLMRAMAAFSGALMHEEVRESLLQTKNADEVVEILKDSKKM